MGVYGGGCSEGGEVERGWHLRSGSVCGFEDLRELLKILLALRLKKDMAED